MSTNLGALRNARKKKMEEKRALAEKEKQDSPEAQESPSSPSKTTTLDSD
jgi:hypothetical protein